MKSTLATPLLLAFGALISQVHGHGQMMIPSYRPITAKFRADGGALNQAGDSELQWSPVEQLLKRNQADFPQAATFNLMNGCRGLVYEKGNNVTTLTAGKDFDLEWFVQAPHPGWMALSIVKPSTDSAGKITYEQYMNVTLIDPFAQNGGTFSQKVTMPDDVEGCDAAGDCALQFYWHSDIANQTYPTCADIIVTNEGSTGTATTAPASGSVGGDADSAASSSYDDEANAPAATTSAPTATTTAPAPTSSCRRRMRKY